MVYSNLKYGLAIDSGSGVGTRLILDLWHEVMGHILMMAMVLHILHMHSLRLTAIIIMHLYSVVCHE